MRKLIILLVFLYTFLEANIVVNQMIDPFTLTDQFDKPHQISQTTKKIIFAFSKQIGHDINDYLEKQSVDYLTSKDTLFVIDLSAAPSMIRSFFIIPKLEKYKYPVLIIKDEKTSISYIDEKNKENIMVVDLDNLKVTSINYFKTIEELKNKLDN